MVHFSGVRARELGIEFEGNTGRWNSITDVPGVEVGHCTLISKDNQDGDLSKAVRTGVTAILPRGRKEVNSETFAGATVLNGNGEVTGLSWVEESGMLSGPVMLTNTYSVGLVRDAVLKYMDGRGLETDSLPVVGEISDEYLNDIRGHHVREQHVYDAIESAKERAVTEGNVGGGTGAVCYEFKGGVGSSSRTVEILGGNYSVGVLVQANHGLRRHLTIGGVKVGENIKDNMVRKEETGSIVGVIATDAPLLPHQLKRLSRRAFLGLARTGSVSSNGSGDFFIAFSTNQNYAGRPPSITSSSWIPNRNMDRLFESTVHSTEEAIINALVAAESMRGFNGHFVSAIPHERVRELAGKVK